MNAVTTTQTDVRDLVLTNGELPATSSIRDQMNYGDFLIKSGVLPKSYRKASEVVSGMQLAKELGLKAGIKSLSRTAVINGSPCIYGELPLAVCQASGQVEDFLGYHFDKNQVEISLKNKNLNEEVYGYYCKIKRKGVDTPMEAYYTLDMAKKAGLLRANSPWTKHPEDMLKWRTIAKILKTLFADIMSGAPVAEYDHNTRGSADIEVTSMIVNGPVVSDLEERFETPEPSIEVSKDGNTFNVVEAEIAQVEKEVSKTTFENTPEPEQPLYDQIMEGVSTDKLGVSSAKDFPREPVQETKEEVLTVTITYSDYVVPIGTHKGKILRDIDPGALKVSWEGLVKHCGMNNDKTAAAYRDALGAYLKMIGRI